MNLLSQKILTLLASDRGALAEAGRKASAIIFDVRAPRSSTYKALRQLVDEGLVATWLPAPGDALRYRVTGAGIRVEIDKRYEILDEDGPNVRRVKAAWAECVAMAVLWCAWRTCGCFQTITEETAPLVRQAEGAAIHADHPGRIGVGENGKRAQRMRRDAEAFGTWRTRS